MSSAKSQLDKMSTMLFNKSLSTMVKGIRNHKDKGEQEYIMKCIGEIKEELKSSYPEIKAGAVQKLIYLQMLGYDMSWASFNIVEVMSAPWFGHKRIGYLAASLAFTKDTDVILLTTHLFRKGFTQNNTANMTADGLQYETGAAISCLACICTPDLGMDLLSDIYGMMNSSRPYIRKKAVLVLLKIFRAWPQALRLSFDRLKEKLNDENQGVVSAAVYVICELAAKNPTNYLRLAPQFYKILTSSSNNWVLIKVVKLLGSLVPEEPRLAKKLMEPLSDIINTTPAKSLLYECVNTLLSGRLTSKTVIRLCLDKLRTFIEDPDQNLKYLGLLGLHKLMKKHPRVVAEHKDLILDCLKDDDVTIRMRALDLITSMVSKKNLTGIVRRLIDHLDVSDGAYREHVLERIIFICSQENYAYISNFEWYISILVDLTHITGASRENALRISAQLMDVVIRVPAVRRYGVRAMTDLLITERLLVHNSSSNAMSEVLYAAAFLVGEFAEYVEEHLELVTVMLKSQVSQLSQSVQNVFIQSFVKVLAAALMQPFDVADKDLEAVFDPAEQRSRDKLAALARDTEEETTADGDEIEEATDDKKEKKQDEDDDEDDATLLSQEEETGLRKLRVKAKKRTFEQWKAFIQQQMDIIMLQLPVFTHSNYVEVQERAVCYHAFISWLQNVFNNPQSVLSSSTSTSTPSSTTTSEITIASPPPATTPAPAPVLDLLSQFDPNASSTPVAAPTPTPAPVTPVPTITSPTSSSGPNPRELLRSIANQFAALFSERLNPVNPKAQKKVPIPKGLDLDAQINEEEHDVESESDIESDDGYSLEDPDDKKNKKDAKKKKNRDSDEEETEYVKPTTKEDREEASKRLAARKQRQENDPFYIKDRPSNSGYSGRSSDNHTSSTAGSDFQTEGDDVDAIPMKRLEDGDLPPVHVKKSDKKSRRRHDLDDDFEEKVTAKTYKIQAADEMPEDAEDSGDDKPHRKASDDELNVDLTTPLGQNEIIPRVQAYNSRPVVTEKPVDKSKMSKEERKAAKAAKKEKRREERGEDKKDKKKKKDKSKDKEKEKDGDKEKDKKKKKKSEDKAKETDDDTTAPTSTSTTPAAASPATANVLDLFDPMMEVKPTPAPTPASPPPATTSTKSTPSASPKSEHKSMENGSSTQPTTEELLKFRDLYHDSRLTIRYRMQPINNTSLALHVEFAYGSKSEKPEKSSKSLTSLSLEFTSTKPYKFPTSRLTLASLSKGQPVYQSTVVEFAGGVVTKPTSVPIQVIYSTSSEQKKKKSEWCIPISVLIQPKKISLTELGQILSNNKTNQLATKAITLASVSVSTALKLIGAILNVQLIEAVSFTATYYGIYIPDHSHICVLVKAKKGDNKNVSIEIKSNTQTISDALMKECCKELE